MCRTREPDLVVKIIFCASQSGSSRPVSEQVFVYDGHLLVGFSFWF